MNRPTSAVILSQLIVIWRVRALYLSKKYTYSNAANLQIYFKNKSRICTKQTIQLLFLIIQFFSNLKFHWLWFILRFYFEIFQNIRWAHGSQLHRLNWSRIGRRTATIYGSMAMNIGKRAVFLTSRIGCASATRMHRQKSAQLDAALGQINKAFALVHPNTITNRNRHRSCFHPKFTWN